MKSTPFDPVNDAAPIPFTDEVCSTAKRMKERGLKWRPHVGCFAWDEEGYIDVPSPFPHRIYFVLNVNHFLKIFGKKEAMVKKLVWLPTWYQCRKICRCYGIPIERSDGPVRSDGEDDPEAELLRLYDLILRFLESSRAAP
jgi:hypothetical protein